MNNSKYYLTKFYAIGFVFFFATLVSLNAKTQSSTQPHTGPVTASAISTAAGKQALFTVGDDGFVIRWTSNGEGEHFQISDDNIKMIAVHPNGNDIAVYETDGFSINRISVWNWATQTRRFVKRLDSTITSLTYTAKGSQLMIGQTNIAGIVFMNSTNGRIIANKVQDSAGTVTFSQSSSSENSSVMYSSLGYLIYTNLRNGQRKASFKIENNLQYPILFNNDVLFAGVKSDTIYLYEASTGELAAKIPADSPIICTSANDNNLYYFETDGKNSVLKMIEVQNGYIKSTPIIVKNFTFSNWDNPTVATKYLNTIYIGMESGELYSVQTNPELEPITALKISKQVYDRIYDVSEQDDLFYFLTDDSIFESSYQDRSINSVAKNTGYTNMIPHGESVILWSKSSRKPVLLVSTIDATEKILFTPTLSLEMLRLQKNKLLFLETSSKVRMYDFETEAISTLYTGTGIQDALLYGDDTIYVAKTAASNPKSALIQVNITTKETTALSVQADIMFSLAENQTETGPFYGVSIVSGTSGITTKIFSYNPTTGRHSAILQLPDEDTDAFSYLKNGVLFSNVGKTQVYAVTISSNTLVKMEQSASLPMKVSASPSTLAVLNKDGSISWFNAQTKKLLTNWYITLDGKWLEF